MKSWPYPRLMAHRGGGRHAPENTLAAIRLGHALGFRAVEVDVRFTRDGVAVLQHDAMLDRNSDGKGAIAERSWADLAGLDAGSWHSERFRGEHFARLADAARLLQSLGMYANIEIKRVPERHRLCGEQVALAVAGLWKGAAKPPLLSSFSAEALAAAREAAPELARGLIVGEPWDGDLAALASLEAASLHLEDALITPELAARVHAHGYRLLAWTVNDPDRARELLRMGVDGLITDQVQEFSRQFSEFL